MTKKGIDISHHQGEIDFDVVKNSIDFVVIREGYGVSTDRKFYKNVAGAKKSGIPVLGVYHFCYSTTVDEVVKEAESCVRNIKESGLSTDTLCFFDFEYDTVDKARGRGVVLNANDCRNLTIAFCDTVEKFGYKAGVYTNSDYYYNWYNVDVLSKYLLWYADWGQTPSVECYLHQYSSKGQIPGIKTDVDLNYLYGDFKMDEKNIRSRNAVVNLVESWVGKNESDGSYKSIIDIYNSFSGPLPRGIKMDYSWAWCATTWSALAIALGYTDIMPIEISCGYLIEEAKKMDCWVEDDRYVPKPGDAVLYDWNDTGAEDNTGWPDHVGTITYVNAESRCFTVVEGNYSDAVKKRIVDIDGRYIRGFITPKYNDDLVYPSCLVGKNVEEIAMEVIAGLWGNGEQRKEALTANGYSYSEVQEKVNEILNGGASVKPEKPENPDSDVVVLTDCYATDMDASIAGKYITTANLYCRDGAGTNKKALCLIPKGTTVCNYGYYTPVYGVKWLLIRFKLDEIQYVGFSSEKYLKKM